MNDIPDRIASEIPEEETILSIFMLSPYTSYMAMFSFRIGLYIFLPFMLLAVSIITNIWIVPLILSAAYVIIIHLLIKKKSLNFKEYMIVTDTGND